MSPSAQPSSGAGLGNPLAHPHWHVLGLTLNADTLITMWAVMAFILGVVWVTTRSLSEEVPTPLQNLFEYLIEFVQGFVQESVNPEAGRMLLDYLVTTLVFLVVANLVGLIPFLHSPTSDSNVPIGMALLVFMLTHWHGFRAKGLSYFRHFAPPAPNVVIRGVLVLMSIIEIFANPVTLSMRLFGNIFAGELLSSVLEHLAGVFGLPGEVLWQAFSLFIGLIQAYVFMALTLTYIGMARASDHEEAAA
jgi:F-type H+-transporting ATPase subunit a